VTIFHVAISMHVRSAHLPRSAELQPALFTPSPSVSIARPI
jgi:hypothetical protein